MGVVQKFLIKWDIYTVDWNRLEYMDKDLTETRKKFLYLGEWSSIGCCLMSKKIQN